MTERRSFVGGAVATEELFPGYRLSSCSYICHLLQPRVIDDFELRRHGFEIYQLDPGRFQPYPDGRSLFFISNQDGFTDVYRYALGTDQMYRVTNLQTGISGITDLSPAMSVAMQSGRMMFSVFSVNSYNVYALEAEWRGFAVKEPPRAPDAAFLGWVRKRV